MKGRSIRIEALLVSITALWVVYRVMVFAGKWGR